MNACVKFGCDNAALIRLNVNQSVQTNNGFLTPKVHGWYCPKCAGSYGDYIQKSNQPTKDQP